MLSFLGDGRTYTWEHGRELASMTKGSTTWTNTYDANGMRTKRTNGITTYTYVYNGSQLTQMTVGNNVLYFTYDAQGHPATVTMNGTVYYYITNAQGDVIAIWNETSGYVADYSYDAWGNLTYDFKNPNHTLDDLNPLRYRGYVWDSETGLYYLQSRYYNPQWGRFINADAYTSTGQGMLGNNMFAYCNNNPAYYVDSAGTLPAIALPIWDYWIIHRMVQERIALVYGFAMEVYVRKDGGGTGRLDLYDGERNEFYEVKSMGAAYTTSTATQMQEYETSTITDWRFTFQNDELTPSPGTNTSIDGSFSYKIYTITYESMPGGLIVYYVDYNPTALTTLAVCVLAMGAAYISGLCANQGIYNPEMSTY